MEQVLRLGQLTAAAGEKIQGYVAVPGTPYTLPVTLICGAQPGKTVYISAGLHSGEYPGVAAAARLAEALEPAQLCGSILLLHCINTSGFAARTDAVVPEDGINLNRIFPGDPAGSPAQRLAAWITTEIFPKADFLIDLHSGGTYEPLTPCLFFPAGCGEAMRRAALEAAAATNIPYLIASHAVREQYSCAASRGVPGLLLERGGAGVCDPAQVSAYEADVLGILGQLGVYPGAAKETTAEAHQEVYEQTTYLEAAQAGVWYPAVSAGAQVTQGALLGRICDIFGRELAAFHAPHDGVVFYLLGALSVQVGDNLIALGDRAEMHLLQAELG